MERYLSYCNRLTLVLLLFSQLYTARGLELSKVNKVYLIDKIKACPTINFVENSKYIEKCKTLEYKDKVMPSEESNDYALCMAVYDIMNKICTYNSINGKNQIKVPTKMEEFDNQIKSLEPRATEFNNFVKTHCKALSSVFNYNLGLEFHQETVQYVNYVNRTLLDQTKCSDICHTHNDVQPLCMVFYWANKLFSQVEPLPSIHDKDELTPKEQVESKKNIPKLKLQQKAQVADPVKLDVHQDLPKIKSQDISIVHNDYQTEKQVNHLEDHVKNEPVNLPPPANEKASITVSKPFENIAVNSNILPKEEANLDNDFNSGEEQQSKKGSENDGDEGKEKGNPDDLKDIDANDGKGFLQEANQDNQQDLLNPKAKSFFPHSSIAKEEEESHFFTYISMITLFCVGLYVGYHNKQKILAMILEGRRSRRGRGSRRRPSTASYRKLDCNLEEAVTSQCNSNVTHVIY